MIYFKFQLAVLCIHLWVISKKGIVYFTHVDQNWFPLSQQKMEACIHSSSTMIKNSERRQPDRANMFKNYITFAFSCIHLDEDYWSSTGVKSASWTYKTFGMQVWGFFSFCGKELCYLFISMGTPKKLLFCVTEMELCSNSLKIISIIPDLDNVTKTSIQAYSN